MSQGFILQEQYNTTFFYGTGNVVFSDVDNSIEKAGIGTYAPAGSQIIIASAEDAANDGTVTVVSTSGANKVIVSGITLTANADDDTATLTGKAPGTFKPVQWYSRLVGIINTIRDATLTLTWSTLLSGGVEASETIAITGGTPYALSTEIKAPFVKVDLQLNAAATDSVVKGSIYAKILT